MAKGVAEVFCIRGMSWGTRLWEWAWQGGVGALVNDSLALSRDADEREAGRGGNREDIEDTGAFPWVPFPRGRRGGPVWDSTVRPLTTPKGGEASELDHIPSHMVFFLSQS